jgi:hypothetical protein
MVLIFLQSSPAILHCNMSILLLSKKAIVFDSRCGVGQIHSGVLPSPKNENRNTEYPDLFGIQPVRIRSSGPSIEGRDICINTYPFSSASSISISNVVEYADKGTAINNSAIDSNGHMQAEKPVTQDTLHLRLGCKRCKLRVNLGKHPPLYLNKELSADCLSIEKAGLTPDPWMYPVCPSLI